MKQWFILLCILLSCAALPAEEITFSGGSTRMSMQQGNQTITLGEGARITSGSVQLYADQINLSGNNFRYVACTKSVKLIDTERGIEVLAHNLFFDRDEQMILIDGFVELDDTINEVHATAFMMQFSLETGEVLLQVDVRLFKHTESGAMVCESDVMRFDRTNQELELKGKATIDWAGDRYEAERIIVDLETEEIAMDGSIKGVVNG
ncbi:MAG: hypothetical protein GX626_00245 [Spirochaetales bacterium]|jgi:lipopolysaccharide export system protein LptA|nr:hypothetical protein [Spirochaetales bacterium]